MRLHYFPQTRKEANVQKRNKNCAFPQNRRPNSLLDHIGKVMEKAIYNKYILYYHATFPMNNSPFCQDGTHDSAAATLHGT